MYFNYKFNSKSIKASYESKNKEKDANVVYTGSSVTAPEI